MIVSAQGIVLKTYDLRETSRIAVLFTKTHGKVSGVMKGIRKDPRKFGSNVDKFSLNDIVYYQYSRKDLHLISQCDLTDYYFSIRNDYRKSLAASYMLELVDNIMPQEHVNKEIFDLMTDFLSGLDVAEDVDKLVHIFQVKILVLSGFKPHIDSCVSCHRSIQGRAKFCLASGGLLCLQCPSSDQHVTSISQGTIASLFFIEKNFWQQCLRLSLTTIVRKELKYLLNNFLVYHLDKKIKSEKYLYRV